MKYFSTFSGVGGFELGIRGAIPEAECIGFSEIDKYASAVLSYRFPNTKNYGDITKINWSEVPDFDLLVGGSPCQDFSIAGKRAGLTGARSGLAFEFVRALEEKRPDHFIWENVKGVLSSHRGWDYGAILNQMAEAGYSLWWQVLNAKDFGVPQNRERIFVVGSRNGSPREVLFERGTDSKDSEPNKKWDSKIFPTIRATHYKNGDNQPVIKQINHPNHSNDRVYSDEGISPTLNTMQGGMRQPFVARETSKTIRVAGGKSPHGSKQNWDSYEIDGRIRRLTPIECERLMSWPDDWTKYGDFDGEIREISDSQRYKMCGNGVVSKVVEEIVKELL